MRVTELTKRALLSRREKRDLEKRGYRYHETDWEIVRGFRIGERILDVKISADGLGVYTKTGEIP